MSPLHIPKFHGFSCILFFIYNKWHIRFKALLLKAFLDQEWVCFHPLLSIYVFCLSIWVSVRLYQIIVKFNVWKFWKSTILIIKSAKFVVFFFVFKVNKENMFTIKIGDFKIFGFIFFAYFYPKTWWTIQKWGNFYNFWF